MVDMDKSNFIANFPFNASPLAVILNSRQGKMPCGKDRWVINTIEAAKYAAAQGWDVLTSIGMNTWEMGVWASSRAGARQVIVCPADSMEEHQKIIGEITTDYNLIPEKTGWLFYPATPKARSSKTDWPRRDQLAIETANILIPVCLRPTGNLERMLNNSRGKKIVNDFRAEYESQSSNRAIPPSHDTIGQGIIELPWDHVCHWTGAQNGPWPGQSRAAYYQSIVELDSYPNGGLAALINIVRKKIIYGSGENIRDGKRVVSLSSLQPKDMLPLMSWRKRYVRYNFEPYGVAILRKTAASIGIRPAIYGPSTLYKRLADSDKPFFQSEGEKGGDWRPENEWRRIGDLDLSNIPSDEMLIIVHHKSEIEALRTFGDWRIVAFSDSD
jgi:hypothetical protein